MGTDWLLKEPVFCALSCGLAAPGNSSGLEGKRERPGVGVGARVHAAGSWRWCVGERPECRAGSGECGRPLGRAPGGQQGPARVTGRFLGGRQSEAQTEVEIGAVPGASGRAVFLTFSWVCPSSLQGPLSLDPCTVMLTLGGVSVLSRATASPHPSPDPARLLSALPEVFLLHDALTWHLPTLVAWRCCPWLWRWGPSAGTVGRAACPARWWALPASPAGFVSEQLELVSHHSLGAQADL
ncbi:hypothetical protein HJG60_011414 [Phyllostomus discolor]|uniref:Uncharacterized protein n=1 Tax=Phyllostomus discolor TaxID=89673 RepID=A0A834A2V6_9CHIR|nr:hypothetical protein HJG60_011414 [Phyllostomus discolor]